MNQVIFALFRKVLSRLGRGAFLRLSLVIVLVLVIAAVGAHLLEPGLSLPDALWWGLVTVTTVGYGDIAPRTFGGRVLGGLLMIVGIGFLGLFTGGLAAAFVEGKSKADRGLKKVSANGHICICGWSHKAEAIIEELRADTKTARKPIVVIANLPEKPHQDENLHFVRGDATSEALEKAGIQKADTAIVLGDEGVEAYARDAKAILAVLTIKNLHPGLYTCIELQDRANYEHCVAARAEEIIVAGELCSSLLVQAAVDHGVTRVVSELVSTRYGSDLYKLKAPASVVGLSSPEALAQLKQKHDVTLVAVESADGSRFTLNPGSGYRIQEGERIVVIADERPGDLA